MSPSNMELRIGAFLSLRLNDEANTAPIPPRSTSTVEGTKTKQTHPEPVSDVATGVAKGGASSGVPGFPSGFDVPSTPYKNKYKTMQKTTTFPKAGLKKSVQIHLDLKDGLQTIAWEKIHQEQRRTGWKQEHPDQPLPDEYPSSEQHENNKTTLIVGGIVLGLTALIIYEIY